MLRYAVALAATARLAGCNNLDCAQENVVDNVKAIAKQTNNPLGNSLLSSAIISQTTAN
jgi:hypothetical protein